METKASLPLFDAHNHLQDERFAGRQSELIRAAARVGVVQMVVNGSGESDWPQVAELARCFPEVKPSFGCHPWYLRAQTPQWPETLREWLDRTPGAALGEIGLDRWILENPERWRRIVGEGKSDPPPSLAEQEVAFLAQLQLAAERDLPVSIHCLQAFGRLRELLAAHSRPARGFLLHSYGGPPEMIPAFAQLGGYFSFPGYFAHPRKARQRDTFKSVPWDRLLIETDAPDQLPPGELIRFPLVSASSTQPLNHPANLAAIYAFMASLRGLSREDLAVIVAENFRRLFG